MNFRMYIFGDISNLPRQVNSIQIKKLCNQKPSLMIIFSLWLRTHNMRIWELEKKHKFLIIIVDTWGSDLTTAAILHLASTVPKKLLFRACNFISYNKVSTAKFLDNENNTSMDPRTRKNPPNGPGLGKVMIEESCSEGSLIGQDTIEMFLTL